MSMLKRLIEITKDKWLKNGTMNCCTMLELSRFILMQHHLPTKMIILFLRLMHLHGIKLLHLMLKEWKLKVLHLEDYLNINLILLLIIYQLHNQLRLSHKCNQDNICSKEVQMKKIIMIINMNKTQLFPHIHKETTPGLKNNMINPMTELGINKLKIWLKEHTMFLLLWINKNQDKVFLKIKKNCTVWCKKIDNYKMRILIWREWTQNSNITTKWLKLRLKLKLKLMQNMIIHGKPNQLFCHMYLEIMLGTLINMIILIIKFTELKLQMVIKKN